MLIYIFRSCAPSVMVVVAETKIWNKKLQKIVDVSHFWMVNPHGECLLLFSTAFWPLCDEFWLLVMVQTKIWLWARIHQNSWTPLKWFIFYTKHGPIVWWISTPFLTAGGSVLRLKQALDKSRTTVIWKKSKGTITVWMTVLGANHFLKISGSVNGMLALTSREVGLVSKIGHGWML